MALRAGRRTAELTHVRPSHGLALRRAALGTALLGMGATLGVMVGGWAWALAALVAIPGATTLAAARHRFVAPCPGCGATLGGAVFVGPDEPVIARGALDHRCDACGIYVDVTRGAVREVPFGREGELPSYAVSLPAARRAELDWGAQCVVCGEARSVGLALLDREVGLLLDPRSPTSDGAVPLCAAHAHAGERSVVVARNGPRITVQFSAYAAYRSFLDANRAVVEVTVREVAAPEA
jgi:hypothetical protein